MAKNYQLKNVALLFKISIFNSQEFDGAAICNRVYTGANLNFPKILCENQFKYKKIKGEIEKILRNNFVLELFKHTFETSEEKNNFPLISKYYSG